MPYTPKTWTLPEPITDVALQHIEDGIEDVTTYAEGLVSGGFMVPTGAVIPFAGGIAPSGYLTCDGSAVSRTTYADLFAVVGEAYGVGDESTTFNLPDLKTRIPVGFATGDTDFGTIGQPGGSKDSVVVAHTHTVQTTGGTSTSTTTVKRNDGTHTNLNTGSTGESGIGKNLQPYVTMLYVIKT